MLTDTAVLPNFFVIGVVKGGTTSLYHYLQQHPDVYMSPVKETNHFAATDMHREHFSHEYALDVKLDLQAYFKGGMKEQIHIAHVDDDEDYMQLFSQVDGERAIGEISNSYAVCSSSAAAIQEVVPDAKIVVMLRNPVTRIWSQYLMNLREGKTAEKDFIKEIESDYSKSLRGWGVTHLYCELGMYYEQMKHYLEVFPKEQIKVLVYEEYRENPEEVISDLFRFLSVDPYVEVDFSQKMNTAAMPRFKRMNDFMVRTGIMKAAKDLLGRKARQSLKGLVYSNKNVPKLDTAARQYLLDFYREDVAKLSSLLNKDFTSIWGFNE